jgi:glycosyltransferase involved in cell wall biosynthesis
MKKNSTPPPLLAFYCSSISWGGLEMNTVRYADWMRNSGFDVIVFCVDKSPIHQSASEKNLNIQIIQRNRKYLDLMNARKVSKQMKGLGVQLVWYRDTRDMDLLFWAKQLFGLRLPFLYQQAMQFGVNKKDVFHTWRFRSIDAWVSTLPFLAEQVKTMTHFPHQRLHVIPLGVLISSNDINRQEARTTFGIHAHEFVIGMLGRIDRLKGQHEALDALRLLHRSGNMFHLLLVGDSTLHEGDEYRTQLMEDVRTYNLQPYVHLLGHTNDVRAFFSCIDCFVLCSKGETFGTVTIEAMAYQVPVVATNSGGSPEILAQGDCGLLYAYGDTESLASCINQLAQEKDKTESMVMRAANRFEEEFSAEISVQRLTQLVHDLLKN